MCLCPQLPRVVTRTALHILQHPRESKHPFGTARLVGLSLPNSQVHVVHGGLSGNLLCPLELPDDAAVLYPHADATDLAAMPKAEHPSTLVVLDGTWAHARRLYRHNPWLQQLRHVRLHPEAPSNYRIRKEPRPDFVSTLEAIAGALRILEPETAGIDTLLTSFDHMIDRQIVHLDAVPQHGRFKQKRQRISRRLPAVLDAPNLLAVYGESALAGGAPGGARELLQWTAVRADTGEVFEVLLRPGLGGPGRPDLPWWWSRWY
jgi:DTW domain-containing protein YfiP